MKYFAIIALATAGLAAPSDMFARGGHCAPASYACKPDNSGWFVCNVDGTWLDGGVCPEKTSCEWINDLPYCV